MDVAVAVITNVSQEVLITRRALTKAHGGYWEFPGGKVESQELPEQALVREINEEIGIHVVEWSMLGTVAHTYSDRQVNLIVYHVYQYLGEPLIKESQIDMQWASLDELSQYHFPEANQEIISMMKTSILALA